MGKDETATVQVLIALSVPPVTNIRSGAQVIDRDVGWNAPVYGHGDRKWVDSVGGE